jgi:type I restriction enzyme S subunit
MKSAIIRDTQDHITEAAVAGSATNFVPPNSVLMVMRSGILRHSFPVAVNVSRVTVNQDLRTLVPAEGIDPQYLAHHLRSIERQILHECAKDGTTVQSIETPALERVAIPIAPASEQVRIVARIDELFAEIAEGEAALERARRDLAIWRRALLKAAITGELTRDWCETNHPTETGADLLSSLRDEAAPSVRRPRRAGLANAFEAADFTSLPGLPEGWTWATLTEIARASSYGTSIKCSYEASGETVLRIPNVRRGRVDLSDVKKATKGLEIDAGDLLSPGDLLIVRTNGSEDLIGRAAVLTEPLNVEAYFASYLIRFRLVGDCDLWRWIGYVFDSPVARSWINKNIASSAGQFNISQGALARMPVPLPPIDEIRFLTAMLDAQVAIADDAESTLRAEETDSAVLKQSVLKVAFEGRLVPQDPADEPASALLARLRAEGNASGSARRRARPRETAQGALTL